MGFELEVHHRRSIRVRGFDYALNGAYFVTICTQDRVCWLGNISGGEVVLSQPGQIVQSFWQDLPKRFPTVDVDAFIVMPNHVHGIVLLVAPVGAQFIAPTPSQAAIPGVTRDQRRFHRTPERVGATVEGAMHCAPTLGEVVRSLKAASTRLIRKHHMPAFAGSVTTTNTSSAMKYRYNRFGITS